MQYIDNRLWSQQCVEDLIRNDAEESLYMDFKAGGALSGDKKKDICKDVSAFANSDGGVLVYGINEVDHKADSLSFIDGNLYTKEWLEQVINDGIQRRIDNIKIHPIRFDGDVRKSVYVVEVPASSNSPHMRSFDSRYYKRFNFQSVPMEEYEVRHAYERRQKVTLDFANFAVEITNAETWFDDKQFEFKLIFHVTNVGRTMAQNYKLSVSIKGAEGCKYAYKSEADYNLVRPLNDTNIILSTTNAIPIFPEEVVNAMELVLIVPFEYSSDFVEKLEVSQSLFTEAERLDDTFQPGKMMKDLISMCIGAESKKEDGNEQD